MEPHERAQPNKEPQPPLALPLRLVDEHGEVHESCPNCEALEDELRGVQFSLTSAQRKIGSLKAELAGELEHDHKRFPEVMALYRYWQERCRHPRRKFAAADMKLALTALNHHSPAELREAIRGAEFDCFETTLKNGRRKRHDDWEQIFRNEKTLESFRERCPDPNPPTWREQTLIDQAHEVAGRVLERARLIESGKDPVACAHLLLEIDKLARAWIETPERPESGEDDDGS